MLQTFSIQRDLSFLNKLLRVLLICHSPALIAASPDNTNPVPNSPLSTSLAYYFDNRSYNTAQIHFSAKSLPADFSFWGFTDFHGDQDNASRRYRISRSFSEYRLSSPHLGQWSGITGLGLQLEYNRNTPVDIDLLRLGLTYKHFITADSASSPSKSWLIWRLFPYENDNDGYQASLAYYFWISEKVNVSGFADRNVNDNDDVNWIIEPQLNVRLSRHTWFLIEYRYNEFEDNNPNLDGSGIAIGISYKIL